MKPEIVGADATALAAVFHGILPSTFDDPILGPVLQRLRAEDPDVFEAVGDVDRSLIWEALKRTPEERLHACMSMARLAASARHVSE
jgi:hypothetical protein